MKMHSIVKPHKAFVAICCVAIFFFIISIVLFFHGGYPQRIIARFSPPKQIEFTATYNNKVLDAWNNCLTQLHVDADVVFFGDSITRRGSFDKYYPDKKICNLGIGSNTIVDMTDRVDMIELVSPEKVFVMGGINSLRDNTLEQSVSEYDTLLKEISEKSFSEVFIISVLPISTDKSTALGLSTNTIVSFNNSIKALADKYGFQYIDLHSKYVDSNGYINQAMTYDGVHLTDNAYQIWINEISSFMN